MEDVKTMWPLVWMFASDIFYSCGHHYLSEAVMPQNDISFLNTCWLSSFRMDEGLPLSASGKSVHRVHVVGDGSRSLLLPLRESWSMSLDNLAKMPVVLNMIRWPISIWRSSRPTSLVTTVHIPWWWFSWRYQFVHYTLFQIHRRYWYAWWL